MDSLCSSCCLMQMTDVALAFEVPGGWLQERDAAIMTVIQVQLMILSFLVTSWGYIDHNLLSNC
jgi:hypothetical protein